MMKILWLTNIPSPYRVDFFNELGKYCRLTVLFERRASAERDASWEKFNIENFKAIFLKGKNIGVAEAFCPSVKKYLKKGEYDHIVVTNFSNLTGMCAIRYMKKKHIPYEIESDGAFAGTGKGIKEKLKKYFLSGAERYFSTADEHDKYYLTYGAEKEKVVRYPFSSICECDIVDTVISHEKKHQLKQELGIKEKFSIISVGRFSYLNGYGKGYDVLLKAATQLSPDVGWYVIGGAPTLEFIKMREELRLTNVHFIDFLDKKQLLKYYRSADVFTLMTIGEAWGLVINEAMAQGLPIISTDRCIAALEMIQDGKNGYVIPVGDVDTLVEKIKIVLQDEELVQDMGACALIKIREYTIEEMAKRHMEIFTGCKN